MKPDTDVVVVGSRCAGAPLATLLARVGVRVTMLEASPPGTDLPLSTHLVQPPGMDVLDRLGVGERVRRVTPPTRSTRFALDDVEAFVKNREGRSAYCVRRSTLDPWLQQTAAEAGVECLYRHRVVDLVRQGERVVGVVAETPRGRRTVTADLVVGADGPHSTIAKLTNAPEYLVEESSRGGYFFYFPAPDTWELPWDSTIEHRGDDLRYVFRTDGGLVVLVAVTSREEAALWGKQWKEKTLAMLRKSPSTRALCDGKEPVGKGCGLLKARFFYRKPIGPGYALVGDAGHFKDFVTGQGMTDAFLDAERLANAIVDGREGAFEHFWRHRDVATLPLHFDALRQGKVGYNSPFNRWVIDRVAARPALLSRIEQVFERRIDPGDLIGMKELLPWMAAALVRGRFDVLRGFAEMGKGVRVEQEELLERKRLLADAGRALESETPYASGDSLQQVPSNRRRWVQKAASSPERARVTAV